MCDTRLKFLPILNIYEYTEGGGDLCSMNAAVRQLYDLKIIRASNSDYNLNFDALIDLFSSFI